MTPSRRPSSTDAEPERIKRLQAFADSLVAKRKDAVDGRAATGIETVWTEDEELYDSVDDLNRGEVNGPTLEKSATLTGGLTVSSPPTKGAKSTIFVNIVQTYVDMAAAAIADMLLPTDDMPFGIEPTPEPDLEAAAKGQDATQFSVGGVTKTASEIAQAMLSEANDIAKRVETRIWDWLTESKWHSEVRKLIDETAKIGTSVLKGPVPIEQRSKKIDRGQNGEVAITMVSKTRPSSKQISPRNFFPDPACGENIQNGSYVWERDKITARQLRKMKTQKDSDGQPFYLGSQIDLVLAEGPNKKYSAQGAKQPSAAEAEGEKFEIWYFYGAASAEDMEASGCSCTPGTVIPAMVTVVNDCVIKATLSTLDSGEFPYDVLIWQRIPGKWYGKGECRKLRHCQRMLNGSVRAMLDNAGLSSGPQIVLDLELIEPCDTVMEITPRKLWRKVAGMELPAAGIKGAIESINIESLQVELMNIVKFAIEMADKIATMPIQQQGQQGVTQETAEGRRLLQNNAGVTKRRMAKIFDDRITEPHVGRYHEWMLLYDDDPELKRELVIDAKGSSALYERDAQNVFITQIGGMVKDPAFDLSPKRWMDEMLKGNKLDPKRFKPTDEERKAMAQQQPPADPRIEVAKIAADTKLKVSQVDTDRDTAYVNAQAERDRQQADHLERKLDMEWQLGVLQYANARRITLDKAKTELAKVAMTLRVQKELATTPPAGAPQVARSVAEPPGRAPKGKAFQR